MNTPILSRETGPKPSLGSDTPATYATYSRILVPLDGSLLAERVLPYARALANGFGGRVELLYVSSPAPEGLADHAHGRYPHQIDANLRAEGLDYLHRVTPSISCVGVEVSCTVKAGDPELWIVEEAEKGPDTLIAMSTHGRSGAARLMLGSVTDKVLHSTSAPVLVIRPRDGKTPVPEAELKHVIVPLDGSPLAEQVLPHVVSLAKALGLTVTLLRVATHRQNGPLVHYLEAVAEKLRGAGLPSVKSRTIGDHPAETIVSVARETPHSMVAMTTHGRSGIRRAVLGSVTDHVVRHCGEPVLVIRAADQAVVWEPERKVTEVGPTLGHREPWERELP